MTIVKLLGFGALASVRGQHLFETHLISKHWPEAGPVFYKLRYRAYHINVYSIVIID